MSSSIRTISKAGKIRKMIYTTSLLSLDKRDSLEFSIEDNNVKHVLEFHFAYDTEKEYSTSIMENAEKGSLGITLHNWDADTWAEVTEPWPMMFNYSNGVSKIILVKFRTQASPNLDYRQFDLTIWED